MEAENLEEQIENLTRLMASLDIPSQVEEAAEIVFDYSSDENPYENPYTNYNFVNKRKKSYLDEDLQKQFEYEPPTATDNYLYRQGIVKIEKITSGHKSHNNISQEYQ